MCLCACLCTYLLQAGGKKVSRHLERKEKPDSVVRKLCEVGSGYGMRFKKMAANVKEAGFKMRRIWQKFWKQDSKKEQKLSYIIFVRY